MKYCDTDLRPDLTFGRAELALKVICLTIGRCRLQTGSKIVISLEDDVFEDSLLADRTVKARSDNAVQFSKTTALLGAAGKVSIVINRRQPAVQITR